VLHLWIFNNEEKYHSISYLRPPFSLGFPS
jgi:hypothetical protein